MMYPIKVALLLCHIYTNECFYILDTQGPYTSYEACHERSDEIFITFSKDYKNQLNHKPMYSRKQTLCLELVPTENY